MLTCSGQCLVYEAGEGKIIKAPEKIPRYKENQETENELGRQLASPAEFENFAPLMEEECTHFFQPPR